MSLEKILHEEFYKDSVDYLEGLMLSDERYCYVEEPTIITYTLVSDFYHNENPYFFKAFCVSVLFTNKFITAVQSIEEITCDEYIDSNTSLLYSSFERKAD